jgi:hypothetical protein
MPTPYRAGAPGAVRAWPEKTILVAKAILQPPVWRIGEETELVTTRMVRSLLLASPRPGPSPVELKQCLGPQRNRCRVGKPPGTGRLVLHPAGLDGERSFRQLILPGVST